MPVGTLIGIIVALLYVGVAVVIVLNHQESSSKLFWLFFFLVIPVIGFVVYVIAGYSYRSAGMRRRLHAGIREMFEDGLSPEQKEKLFPDSGQDKVEDPFRQLATLMRTVGEGNRVYDGNSFEIITSGLRKRELLLEDIRKAERFIHIEYFRFGNDKAGREVRDLLQQKAAEGVEVRFLNNNMIGWNIPRSYFRKMRRNGIEVLPFTHIRLGIIKWIMRINHQNHRKIVVIDGKVAYTGGMNLNDNYFYKWRDTHLRIVGPVIGRLQAAFVDNWTGSGGRLSHPLSYYFPTDIPHGDGPMQDKLLQVVTDAPENAWPAMQMGFEWILQNARTYAYIQTPYFIPPESLLVALKTAALRGVDVRLMLPKKVDTLFVGPANRAFFEECLEAGVRIFERSGEFIHSKTLVADDGVSIIGASNWDLRSFSINNEVNTIIYDRETALRCREIFLTDMAKAQELRYEEWTASRTWYQEAGSQFVRMFYWIL